MQRWLEYCRRRGHHTQHPTVSEILDFLPALFAQGLGYRATNSYRSALSSILQVPGVEQIGVRNFIYRFMLFIGLCYLSVYEFTAPTTALLKDVEY